MGGVVVWKWVRLFQNGQTNVFYEGRRDRLSIVTDGQVKIIDGQILEINNSLSEIVTR